jgi:hypothetical protein
MSMPEIVKRTIAQAIKLLDASGAKYKIIDQDGNQYGSLIVTEPKKASKSYKHPPGTMHKFYYPLIKDMQPGDVVAIKNFDFEPRALQGAVTAWASEHWGKGSYKTCMVGPDVEILRCS